MMSASQQSQREKGRERAKEIGGEIRKEEKSGRRRRIATGSKPVRIGQSSHPSVCPNNNGFGTKITAATRTRYSVMA